MSELTLSSALKLWREHGGETFGPRVRHVSMKESDFLEFCQAVQDLIGIPGAEKLAGTITWDDVRAECGTTELSIFDLLNVVNGILAKRSVAPTSERVQALEEGRRQGIVEAGKFVYELHVHWADERDRAARETQERAIAQALVQVTADISSRLSALIIDADRASNAALNHKSF